MVDLLGRTMRGAGRVDYRTATLPSYPDVEGPVIINFPIASADGVRKLTLVPGLKLNLKGNLLLSMNVLVALADNGLHARFTPVVGLDLTK